MQDDIVERPAAERQRVGPECDQRQPDVFFEVRVEKQDVVFTHRTVVVEDHLAVPEPAHNLGPILHLRGRHRRYAERAVDRGDAAADAQCEAPAGEPVHGGRPRSGDQRMAGVVIGCGGGDLHPAGDGAGGPDKRGGLLYVPAFGDECGAEAQFLAAAGLVHQGRRSLPTSPGQQVVAQFVKRAIGAGQFQTPCL